MSPAKATGVASGEGATRLRSDMCGALRLTDAGRTVRLGGWVHRTRNLGGLVFVDLRDRAGIVQVSFGPDWSAEDVRSRAASLGAETVVLLEGEVAARPAEMRNSEMATGDIEVRARTLTIVGPAETPPIQVARAKGEKLAAEELRLRHRHLDLRRPELQENLILRHTLMQEARRYLSQLGFLEMETPILTKPTPEGARDYLVPSRVHPGEFYALPQSPQLYKQLLMISGFDRYFQIARCFRDEDLRADRQPEFTQIDIEASFVEREDVLNVSEGLIRALWTLGGRQFPDAVPRLRYDEAMERYGVDRPDLRFGLEISDFSDLFRDSNFTIARAALEAGGRVRGLRVPGGAALSRSQLDEVEEAARGAGARGILRLKRLNGALEGPAARHLPSGSADALLLQDGDLCLMVAAEDRVSNPALDRVRQDIARRMSLVPEGGVGGQAGSGATQMRFVWIVDFPLFHRDAETGGLVSVNHPFTAPHPDDLHLLDSSPEQARAIAYDLVLNGTELGGGSIRISDPALQSHIFSLLGISPTEAASRFGFLLEGLRAGCPPHGGIAFGFDRIAMLLAGAGSLRDVIAYPKTTAARALFEGAPSPVGADELRELRLRVTERESR